MALAPADHALLEEQRLAAAASFARRLGDARLPAIVGPGSFAMKKGGSYASSEDETGDHLLVCLDSPICAQEASPTQLLIS
jgi:hypothetical protein